MIVYCDFARNRSLYSTRISYTSSKILYNIAYMVCNSYSDKSKSSSFFYDFLFSCRICGRIKIFCDMDGSGR